MDLFAQRHSLRGVEFIGVEQSIPGHVEQLRRHGPDYVCGEEHGGNQFGQRTDRYHAERYWSQQFRSLPASSVESVFQLGNLGNLADARSDGG